MSRLVVGPSDRLLEIGCGRGTLVSQVCDRLVDGQIVAVDRSATMIRQARERNADHVAAGRAVFHTTSLDRLDPAAGSYDTVVALNVNLFWVRPAGYDLALITRLLRPGGTLHLIYELPVVDRAEAVAKRLEAALTAEGYEVRLAHDRTRRGNALLAVVAAP